MARKRSLWRRIKELFSYDEPRKVVPTLPRRTSRKVTPDRSFSPTPNGTQNLEPSLHTEGLTPEQRSFVESQNMQNLYKLAYKRKRISYHQRRNARRLIVEQFADAGIDFYDVMDYEEWKRDMGYGAAA